MKKVYFIKKQNFYNLYNLAKNIHCYNSIVKNFCESYEDVDDFYKILPMINQAQIFSDKLYAEFINLK